MKRSKFSEEQIIAILREQDTTARPFPQAMATCHHTTGLNT